MTKTNNVNGRASFGSNWTWLLAAANVGAGPATFGNGQAILRDNLPNSNVTYGPATVSNQTGISGTA